MTQKGQLQAPDIDTTELQDRKLLEAKLLVLEAHLRKFDRIRHRLTAQGRDDTAEYRRMLIRRDELVSGLKERLGRSFPSVTNASQPFFQAHETLASLPIVPSRFLHDRGVFAFGTSGSVQLAPAAEGTNVVAHGRHPSDGQIETVPGSYPGVVTYSGILHVGPDSIPPDQYDPSIDYFWLRNWKYLIPFPPPTTESRLTYRFDVYARTNIFFGGGEGQVMVFVSVGETGNLTTGSSVPVDIDAGWPLIADVTEPAESYNGHYGFVSGSVSVQRSFLVGANRVPGVAVVVGAVGALSMMAELRLVFADHSSIGVSSQGLGGRVGYSYEPQLVAQA